jgi:hypothetical protein
MRVFSLQLLSVMLLLPTVASVFCGQGPTDTEDIDAGASTFYPCYGVANGKTKFVWKTTGDLTDDEYWIRVKQNGATVYRSAEIRDSLGSGGYNVEKGTAGLAGYNVEFQCKNEFFDCEKGFLEFKLVECGCPGEGSIVLEPCKADSLANAADAVCGASCDQGFYYDFDVGCTECPNFKILATTSVGDYSSITSQEQCGVLGTTGFWSLAASGSVAQGGTVVQWSLARSLSRSEGVENSNEFAQAYGTVRGQSTYMETSVSVGFTATASAGLFGSGVSASTSIDYTSTTGSEKSFEVSQEATDTIGNAVSSVITSGEEITCSQTCGPDPNDPSLVQGFIFNWVDAVFDDNTKAILHYVRTCATVCKNTSTPPICPPGKCFNRECNICVQGAFLLPELDALASAIPPTAAPTASPTMERKPNRPICFSGTNTVEVQGKGVVSMTSLEIGDFVKSGEGQFSRVYTFGHIEREAQGTYYQITTEGLSTPLEISGPHIVYANGKAVRASDVSVGDMLGENQVSKIELVRSMGVYAPMTESGDIVVSGVVASSYVALWDYSIAAQKMVYHAALAPLRMTCALNFDFCRTESYNADGISSYYHHNVHAMSVIKEFGVGAQMTATLIVSPAIAAAYAAEQTLLLPSLMTSVVGGVYVYTKSRKSVKAL